MAAEIPAVVEERLDAIHCTHDGKIILSSSNLSGRYWNGALWCFKSAEDAPSVEKCITGTGASSGICDFTYLDTNVAVLGLDSGVLEIFKLEKKESEVFTWIFGVCEHDDYITSLDVNSSKSSLITVGADKCVKIWDTETWATTATYRPVHGGKIWQVSCSDTEPNLFLTCGQDCKILLFDKRLSKPATVVETPSLKGEPTSISWKPTSPDTFAVGDESGQVLVKTVHHSNVLCSWLPHKRRVHRIIFSKCHPWIATCADDTDICVTEVKENSPVIVYKDDRHTDFVRGLTWSSEDELLSCGWDTQVFKHVCKEDPVN